MNMPIGAHPKFAPTFLSRNSPARGLPCRSVPLFQLSPTGKKSREDQIPSLSRMPAYLPLLLRSLWRKAELWFTRRTTPFAWLPFRFTVRSPFLLVTIANGALPVGKRTWLYPFIHTKLGLGESTRLLSG